MTTWQDWAKAVLAGISAPASPTNFATLQGWTSQEKTGLHPAPAIGSWALQWCNPLNTTEAWPGARDSGAQPGPHDVKIYPSLVDGTGATIATLLNGRYPGIVANLQASLPACWWTGAGRTQLDTWGTGESWLDFVPLTGDVMATIDEVYNMLRVGHTSDGTNSILQTISDQGAKQATAAALAQDVIDLKTAIAAISVGGGLTSAQAAQLAQIQAATGRIENNIGRIENNLNAPRPPA
jgi:hypothetical protein